MWGPYVNALKLYYNDCLDEWISRGFKNMMEYETIEGDFELPHWLGHEEFHSSHRANLLRKDSTFYSQFGWTEDPSNPYLWMDREGKWYKHIVETGERIYLSNENNVVYF
jgi:hypothetical protein